MAGWQIENMRAILRENGDIERPIRAETGGTIGDAMETITKDHPDYDEELAGVNAPPVDLRMVSLKEVGTDQRPFSMKEAISHLLPKRLQDFIASCTWTFAKTYADTWPHEYIVREKVDEVSFVDLVSHIRAHGYEDNFYDKTITYFDHDGMVYWTMGSPIEKTVIINRCQKEQTYRERFKNGTLPKKQPFTNAEMLSLIQRLSPEDKRRLEAVLHEACSPPPQS